jgi:hypothetical protein
MRAEILELAMRASGDVDCELPFRVAQRASQLEPSSRGVEWEIHACELLRCSAEQAFRAGLPRGRRDAAARELSGRLRTAASDRHRRERLGGFLCSVMVLECDASLNEQREEGHTDEVRPAQLVESAFAPSQSPVASA